MKRVNEASSRTRVRVAPFVAGLAVMLAGCFAPEGGHTMRFELVQEPSAAVITNRKSYFFWGLVPTVKVDVLKKCPYGAAAIVDGSDPRGGMIWIPTFGLWSRRTTTYYCRASPPPEETSP